MKKKQPLWNEVEAALLLDAYLQVIEHSDKRMFYIEQVSEQLRQMAVDQGIEIDNIYRDVAGITFQMKRMEAAWTGKSAGAFNSTKLFDRIVKLYKTNRTKFTDLLKKSNQ